jgi:hypothetical protein
MPALKELERRVLISQMINLRVNESENLTRRAFYPVTKLTAREEKNTAAANAEIEQQITAKAKESKQAAHDKLKEAYLETSNLVDSISDLMGKENK